MTYIPIEIAKCLHACDVSVALTILEVKHLRMAPSQALLLNIESGREYSLNHHYLHRLLFKNWVDEVITQRWDKDTNKTLIRHRDTP